MRWDGKRRRDTDWKGKREKGRNETIRHDAIELRTHLWWKPMHSSEMKLVTSHSVLRDTFLFLNTSSFFSSSTLSLLHFPLFFVFHLLSRFFNYGIWFISIFETVTNLRRNWSQQKQSLSSLTLEAHLILHIYTPYEFGMSYSKFAVKNQIGLINRM